MNLQTKPQMSIILTGEKYKMLKVIGTKGMEMPSHFSTMEAVIIVQQGEALLKLTKREIHLKTNDSAIIPANEHHILKIKEDFQAIVIMEIESQIKFVNN